MSKTTVALIAFLAGCGAAAVAPLVIPPAHAQTTQRWETLCVQTQTERGTSLAENTTAAGNAAGREGWEPFSSSQVGTSYAMICFKRPAP